MPRPEIITIRLDANEAAILDALRGAESRADYIRRLLTTPGLAGPLEVGPLGPCDGMWRAWWSHPAAGLALSIREERWGWAWRALSPHDDRELRGETATLEEAEHEGRAACARLLAGEGKRGHAIGPEEAARLAAEVGLRLAAG